MRKFMLLFLVMAIFVVVLSGSVSAACLESSTGTSNSRLNTYLTEWESALTDDGVCGKTWIGVSTNNGATDSYLLNGDSRLTIVFVPESTNFDSPIEMIYFFHGIEGFYYSDGNNQYDDFNNRLAPQIKDMMNEGRNFVIVFPEMPWSAGDQSGDRAIQSQYSLVWDGTDSDLSGLHNEVLSIVGSLSGTQQIPSGGVTLVGHSAGGSALRRAASNGYMEEIGVVKITFSDADYGSQTASVWNNYVESNPNTELNLLVSYPVKPGYLPDPYDNTKSFIEDELGISDFDPAMTRSFEPNINYVPLDMYHEEIGTISLSWQSGDALIASSSSDRSRGSSNVLQIYAQSCNDQDTCEELDQVWELVSGTISSDLSGSYWGFGPDGGVWKSWDDLYGVITTSSSSTTSTTSSLDITYDSGSVPVVPEHYVDLSCTDLSAMSSKENEKQEAIERGMVDVSTISGIDCGGGVVCYVKSEAISPLTAIAQEVSTSGNKLYVSYGYRDAINQIRLWKCNWNMDNSKACSPNPLNGVSGIYQRCSHLSGSAIDIQLRDSSGNQLDSNLLRPIMFEHGWVRYTGEDWHFEYKSPLWYDFRDNCELAVAPTVVDKYGSREGYCDVVQGIN